MCTLWGGSDRHGSDQSCRMHDVGDLYFYNEQDSRQIQNVSQFDVDLILDRPNKVSVQVASHDDGPMSFLTN